MTQKSQIKKKRIDNRKKHVATFTPFEVETTISNTNRCISEKKLFMVVGG